ncbi:MAG: glutamate formimidoyltransferase [Gemmatimonadaceae bacterium]
MRLVECVPNFSEGRRGEVIAGIHGAIARVPGVAILDVSSDRSHNRTVVTFVAEASRAVDAQFEGIRAARDLIDLTAHSGAHPRIGAADVVPFVPLDGVTMDNCIAMARQLGERVGCELDLPVFLYERAATLPARRNLAVIRRGGLDALRAEIGTSPVRTPDYGPSRIHPTAGAVAIGARHLLVAYNVYLGPAANVAVAKAVARAVRESSGGLPGVKALGLEVDGQAQVSMNLVDIDRTSLVEAYKAVEREAAARGVATTWSEIVGLVPERALPDGAEQTVRLARYSRRQILEHRLRAMADGSTLG